MQRCTALRVSYETYGGDVKVVEGLWAVSGSRPLLQVDDLGFEEDGFERNLRCLPG